MIIDFNKMENTVIKNFKGGEMDTVARKFEDDTHRIMYITLEPGASIGLHTHEQPGCEIIYVLEGAGKVLYDDTTERIEPGMCHYCPAGHSHSVINDNGKPLVFFAVVEI